MTNKISARSMPSMPGSRRASEPPGHGPTGARNQVAYYLGVVTSLEEQLRDALVLVSERHERNYEVARGATVLAVWSAELLKRLETMRDRYGHVPSETGEMLRAALLGGTRIGVVGEMNDITDLAVLAERADMTWTILFQGARELRDDVLLDVAATGRDHTRRQIAWFETMIEHEAPDAMAVVPDWSGQVAASVPKRPDAIASVPDPIWGPVVAAVLILLVGLIGLALGKPWLLPSLGPSAVLFALAPAHPQTRAWNTLIGHLIGIGAGFVGIVLAGAATAPSPIVQGELVPARVIAATIAILLTVLLSGAVRATHPPAAATTLLVALGATATADKALSLFAGVVVIAIAGELLRRVRLERRAPAERMAPHHSLAWSRLHGLELPTPAVARPLPAREPRH